MEFREINRSQLFYRIIVLSLITTTFNLNAVHFDFIMTNKIMEFLTLKKISKVKQNKFNIIQFTNYIQAVRFRR